ncbi:MAG: nitrate reductase molybdenum cofactor assembly chaperone [Gammaproteobacteria bacterium]|nr:nitrate reductase molybdenum cofactor assembly chaperone [Gammaproteobacteria bacterium]
MNHARPLIALARLLEYPEADVRDHARELLDVLGDGESRDEGQGLESLRALGEHLQRTDLLDLQTEYVETFDRGRSTSLNLYEHLYGDARGRGPAMAELAAQYERAGLVLTARQLPDYLPAFLEYASTLSGPDAGAALRRVAVALGKIAQALERRRSPWLAAIVAALRLAGVRHWRSSVEPPPGALAEPAPPDWAPDALDAAWTEQPIQFLGAEDPCAVAGRRRGSAVRGG